MPEFQHADVSIHYEDTGTGQGGPLLLLAPGAMNATIGAWQRAALNPLAAYDGEYRMISMDHRNAGLSRGPLLVDDPWGGYVADQIGLLDHLGVERVHVVGCCIGVSYALKMCEAAPDRVLSLVLEQPIGVVDENRRHWPAECRAWGRELARRRPDVDADTAEKFASAMWDQGEFVVSVTTEFVRSCRTPMAVLPGVDLVHPREIALKIADLAPNAELIDPWKDSPTLIADAVSRVRKFIARNSTS